MGEDFLPALARLPKRSGLIFRHYTLPPTERRLLFEAAKRVARKRGILIFLAGTERQATAWRADGSHGLGTGKQSHRKSVPVHNLRELIVSKRAGAASVFISPVFPTRSHPDGRTLGRRGFASLARQFNGPVIALGGMTPKRARTLKFASGWAGIDNWLPAAPH